ncbi:MAG: erythromycin esterase family protein [Deltaproteobacteria bacterium]|nr:erythromycin esterase family protein [Deltaproteobacteria bacterium]
MDAQAHELREIVGRHSYATEDICQRILRIVGDAPLVLIGEATHGTREFYAIRAEITKRLISEKGFAAVAVEADWPDAYRVNRYVQLQGKDSSAYQALRDFIRFPVWMWRNEVLLEFVDWLRSYNVLKGDRERVGFYGMDLYSLCGSVYAVLDYLRHVDPKAAKLAKERYECFAMYLSDPQAYGYAAYLGIAKDCEREAIQQLIDLRNKAAQYVQDHGLVQYDAQFDAERNAVVIKRAEAYYKAMFGDPHNTWNLRDSHMFETIQAIMSHLSDRRNRGKLVVWAHNSHIGDARATEVGSRELNIGQLAREHYGTQARLIGFTTYSGTVTAASNWGESSRTKTVRPALPGSCEELFHRTSNEQFVISFESESLAREILSRSMLQRAIGVIYRPETEKISHYFRAKLAEQFDAVIHIDHTTAIRPVADEPFVTDEIPETYPTGL